MICVKRDEIITMMQEQQVLMTKRLQDAIIKMSDGELVARWAGIQLLAEGHRPGNRPGWMGKHFCNPTTLFVGQRELDRKALDCVVTRCVLYYANVTRRPKDGGCIQAT